MPADKTPRAAAERQRVADDALRWTCDPEQFAFKTTADLGECPINIIGQDRAQQAISLGLDVRADGFNIFVTGSVGSGRSTVVRRLLRKRKQGDRPPDLLYVHNFEDPDRPRKLIFEAGRGESFKHAMDELIDTLSIELPKLFDSEDYAKHRVATLEMAEREQKSRLKEFEKQVLSQGFALVQVQMGPITRPQIVPVVAGSPMDMDQVEQLVEQGQFKREDFEQLRERLPQLRIEMEALGKTFRKLDRGVRHDLQHIDHELARPLIEEALAELRGNFKAEGLELYLEQLGRDLVEHVELFREGAESRSAESGGDAAEAEDELVRYRVNLLVNNAQATGRPIIWETAPSYRNLFGAIERRRSSSGGEWETDHMRIKAGSLLRANGGILVLDAMDVLVEPAAWPALKRTLRTRKAEVQQMDLLFPFSPVSLKPEALPIDVKVVMIGTQQIYGLLYALDEDFKKVFKIKAQFATHTPLSTDELLNYACFVHKKINDDGLPAFHRDAVAAVVEHGVRLAGHHKKLTTRFTEIADLVREAGYWARRGQARVVRAKHVDRALQQKLQRFDLLEEMLRERIAEGQVLLDLDGSQVGQVNGLAVLDLGDHAFGQPSRISATTAMGRAGILDLDREAEMSGAIHTKGVLILSGFLRARFAQDKPLTLTASLSFEQNYGGVDGDSASSAELYALLSSLSGVPIDQGIAVTGSVNQRGEVQPIGGVNEKIEGFFAVCNLIGLTGRQGVMIPRRNLPQLMLRKEVVEAVRKKRFHVWAVSTIEEGLEVLTGRAAATRDEQGRYHPDSTFGLADARLRHLAQAVQQFGAADVGLAR